MAKTMQELVELIASMDSSDEYDEDDIETWECEASETLDSLIVEARRLIAEERQAEREWVRGASIRWTQKQKPWNSALFSGWPFR